MNKVEKLTKREMEILLLLAEGFDNKNIAKILNISIHTVKANLEMIYYKLNVKNRLQAVVKSMKEKLIILEDII